MKFSNMASASTLFRELSNAYLASGIVLHIYNLSYTHGFHNKLRGQSDFISAIKFVENNLNKNVDEVNKSLELSDNNAINIGDMSIKNLIASAMLEGVASKSKKTLYHKENGIEDMQRSAVQHVKKEFDKIIDNNKVIKYSKLIEGKINASIQSLSHVESKGRSL